MSRLSKFAEKEYSEELKIKESSVKNFMGGTSYKISPINTLRIIASSSIFGEPQYYRDNGIGSPKNIETLNLYSINEFIFQDNKSAIEVFEQAIDNSLEFDFKSTLDLALELRTLYLMRLNPSIIFTRASMHPNRKSFNENNPGYMKSIGKSIAKRPDDLTNQFEYYMFKNGKKNGLPSLIKRTWAERLEEYSRYQLNKYKEKKLIDLIRISHANNENINELMRNGKLEVNDNELTWEALRSQGKQWVEIIETISIPHMALLRNLRGIFKEIEDSKLASNILQKLKDGVKGGNQFPFRYWSAYKSVKNADVNHKQLILDSIEECIDISVDSMPKLKGKTICLSDNSGSAWGSFNSEYGEVTVAEIGNLSSVITSVCSDEGEIGVFGDRLEKISISKRNGILTQLKRVSNIGGKQGSSTENGIWIFFDEAINNKIHYDNIFIYSDMQAGHGGLYGEDQVAQSDYVHTNGGTYIDVLAMARDYRKKVNPKANIFTVQTAGYDNSVIPENIYRGSILSGWTGKESLFAKSIIEIWDSIENTKN